MEIKSLEWEIEISREDKRCNWMSVNNQGKSVNKERNIMLNNGMCNFKNLG